MASNEEYYVIDSTTLTNLANKIRAKLNSTGSIKCSNFASKIDEIINLSTTETLDDFLSRHTEFDAGTLFIWKDNSWVKVDGTYDYWLSYKYDSSTNTFITEEDESYLWLNNQKITTPGTYNTNTGQLVYSPNHIYMISYGSLSDITNELMSLSSGEEKIIGHYRFVCSD